MTRLDMPTLIGFTEAIEQAGPVLFGDDWIGYLTQKEIALVKAHGPRRGKGVDGSIKPCPQKYRRALDRALGRELRVNAQRGTVVDWLQEHGFVTSTSRSCDAVALSLALGRRRTLQTAAATGKGAVEDDALTRRQSPSIRFSGHLVGHWHFRNFAR